MRQAAIGAAGCETSGASDERMIHGRNGGMVDISGKLIWELRADRCRFRARAMLLRRAVGLEITVDDRVVKAPPVGDAGGVADVQVDDVEREAKRVAEGWIRRGN